MLCVILFVILILYILYLKLFSLKKVLILLKFCINFLLFEDMLYISNMFIIFFFEDFIVLLYNIIMIRLIK